jgi:S1-C subfamily serine protease
MKYMTRTGLAVVAAVAAGLAALLATPSAAQDLDAKVKEAEAKRIAAVEKVRPSVVAIFGPGGNGGGSGVLIDEDGYALTNFHVTAGAGDTMKCGLPDGVMYDAVLVGRDKVGDVALVKLLPKKEGQKFPFAKMGDSDKLRAGQWSLAMGNPFLLATDFNPTVTYGMISGVHRWQEPAGILLEYTDCIQIDTSINPGNSGGPLFNMDGELVGINGRGSFDKRSRINSGVGYAISINQIKNFMGHLRAGLETDHASLGALVESDGDDGASPRLVVKAILEDSDAARRGLEVGDELTDFAGRHVTSVNQYKNILGIFPRGWRLPIVYRRNEEKKQVLVRLMGVQRQEVEDPDKKAPAPRPAPRPAPGKPSPAAKYFQAKPGFANYYFNKLAQDRVMEALRKQGDFSGLKGEWLIKGTGEADNRRTNLEVSMKDDGKEIVCNMNILGLDHPLKPIANEQPAGAQSAPPKSGGFLLALYQYRQLLVTGARGFDGEFMHGGVEPFYPPPPGVVKWDTDLPREMAEVIRTRHANATVKWYFSLTDHRLLGFESTFDQDPCEVFLSDYKAVDGRMLPQKMVVRRGSETYAEFTKLEYKLAAK